MGVLEKDQTQSILGPCRLHLILGVLEKHHIQSVLGPCRVHLILGVLEKKITYSAYWALVCGSSW